MNLRAETDSLRRSLKGLAEEFDTGLNRRYALQFLPEDSCGHHRSSRG